MRQAALLFGLMLAASACGEEEIEMSTTPPASAQPAASAVAAVAAAEAVPKVDIQESEFTESERTRDPFRSYAERFLEESKGKAKSQREVVLAQYAIDELKL